MRRLWLPIIVVFAAMFKGGSVAIAQSPPPATRPAEDLISLEFPPNMDLRVLIQYVGSRLGINFIYDDQTVAQKITIVSPTRIPKDSLLSLLESALKLKGLVLADADQPNWKRILPITGLNSAAAPTTQSFQLGNSSAAVIAQVFVLRYADAQRIDPLIRPFLTQPGGNSVPFPDQHLLIVSDFASNMAHVAELVRLMDQPLPVIATRLVPIKNVDVGTLVPEVQQVLSARDKAQSPTANIAQPATEVLPDIRDNQIILIGPPDKVPEVEALATSLDVPLPLQTQVYTMRSMSPERLDKLVRGLIDPVELKRLYQSVVDKDSGLLVVTTTTAIQQRIASLKDRLDLPANEKTSPIRFYKLTNSTAADVLATIRSLENTDDNSGDEGGGMQGPAPSGSAASAGGETATPAGSSSQSPVYHDNLQSSTNMQLGAGSTGSSSTGMTGTLAGGINNNSATNTGAGASAPQPIVGVHTADATITADPNTNTIIVEADPARQKIYESLIKTLDKRRPQVLIECTLVTIDHSHNFSLGVELGADSNGKPKVVTFNSFGLSTPSPTTGVLSLTPAAGFNGTLLNSSVAQVVVQALATDAGARVLSAPRILVNDNATGTLESVQEEPYTSVNASTTVSTTSFGGYADAGTVITLTPHISEGDHLQLEYTVSLNNFSGSASNGIPPPRQTDSVESKITIPDDTTVVVGGLNSTNFSDTKQKIPILGDIPILKYLFSQDSRNSDHSTLFVFIRPTILRDDQFQDLKFFSERDVSDAGLPGDYPKSRPLLIRPVPAGLEEGVE